MDSLSPLAMAVTEGDVAATRNEVSRLLAESVPPLNILQQHLIVAMNFVGEQFDAGEFFVPELLLAARAMQEAMGILDPLLKAQGVEKAGRVLIGTVAGDMHDIGKNLVASLLEGGGFDVTDLGIDVSKEKFLNAIRTTEGPVLVALSALLTTTMPQMKILIDALAEEGLRGRVKVIVGGAPVSEAFARQIGADGYGDSANAAVQLARQLATR